MGERRRRIDKVLDPEFLVGLPEWPLDELRRPEGSPAQGGPRVIAARE
jgi:hypothetical protein